MTSSPPRVQHFHRRTLVAVFHIHGQLFIGLAFLAVNFLQYRFRPGDAELIPFTAHVFNKDAEMQFAAAGDPELVRIIRLFDAQ